ncbi:MAG: AMP-binding protein [Spirochaetia bacterium]|nr:AMP-binding protein [Spirochaetia bacterium]
MYRTLVDVIHSTFRRFPQKTAYLWRENKEIKSVTYADMAERVKRFSIALIDLGIKSGDKVALFADVSYYWILGNLSIQNIGAVDVPRGTDSTGDELAYIVTHSEASLVMVHHADQIEKIESSLKKNKKYKVVKYLVLQGETGDLSLNTKKSTRVFTLDDLLKKGESLLRKNPDITNEIHSRHKLIDRDSLAAIIYTSGTTGKPKGVMLSQTNLTSQINLLPHPFDLDSADRMLTLLPPWHVFGRVLEYIFFEAGASIFYTDIKNMGEDMKQFKPTYVPAVPRVWEGIYNKVMVSVKKGGKEKIFNFFKVVSLIHFRCMKIFLGQNRRFKPLNSYIDHFIRWICFIIIGFLSPLKVLGHFLVFKKIIAATGGKLRGSISGGGALPAYIDEFFAAVGINIYEGYGLTETSPVLAVRLPGNIVPGTVGPPAPMTQMKLVSLDGVDVTGETGAKGTLFVKGPQVMMGYYKDPVKTAEVLDSQKWFNTGDLVRITLNGEISIVGRSKDTIVLRGGENVEPVPIEAKIMESPFIDQIMLVGQDEKNIGALIVVNEDALKEHCHSNNLPLTDIENRDEGSLVYSLINKEIQRLNSASQGFKAYERVGKFKLLGKAFEVGDEMSNTFKVKRFVVTEKYKSLIKEMYRS